MELAHSVRRYYLDNFDKLPADKRFHLVSRLASWSQDAEAAKLLEKQLSYLLPEGGQAKDVLAELINDPPKAKINAMSAREQYFAAYPKLRGVSFALFRVRHLLTLFGIDTRDQLLEIVPYDELGETARMIHDDEAAMRILSTYAINYLYLSEHILYRKQPELINLDYFYELGNGYDTTEPQHMQLLIYLYTHCIIGETNFYAQPLSDIARPTALRMLERLETLITANFTKINLDNKLEFLVCCRIAGYDTPLAALVLDECERSASANGTFLVDRHNDNAQSNKTSLSDSEHRNVLFVMSQLPYRHA